MVAKLQDQSGLFDCSACDTRFQIYVRDEQSSDFEKE